MIALSLIVSWIWAKLSIWWALMRDEISSFNNITWWLDDAFISRLLNLIQHMQFKFYLSLRSNKTKTIGLQLWKIVWYIKGTLRRGISKELMGKVFFSKLSLLPYCFQASKLHINLNHLFWRKKRCWNACRKHRHVFTVIINMVYMKN